MPKSKQKDETIAPVGKRWAPPEDWVPLSHEEYLVQQRWVRDLANEELALRLSNGIHKGMLAVQQVALQAAAEIERLESRARVDTLSDTLSWTVFTDANGQSVDVVYDDQSQGSKADA